MPQGVEVLPNGLPDPALRQPARVEVAEAVNTSTTFSLMYDFSIEDSDFPMLTDTRIGPEADIALRVAQDTQFLVLARGPVTRQRIRILTGGAGSVLEAIGADLTVALAREAKVQVWPETTDAAALTQLLSAAAILPNVALPSSIVHSDSKHALVQRESDLHFIRRLARRHGCWMWLEYDPVTALPTARIERPPVDGPTVAQLHLAGSERNVDELRIEWDVERMVGADAAHHDQFGDADMDGSIERSPLNPMADQALADIVTSPRKARLSTPVDDAGDLMVRSEAALIESGWFVTAQLSVRKRVLKKVLRPAGVVEIHGAGTRHSGKYLVSRVTHFIDDDDHRMDLTLVRNAWF